MFGNDSWVADTVASVNDDDAFATAAEHFDGSVALVIDDRTVWLKLYRGEIIDTEPYVPQFGATFRLVGDADAWRRLAAGECSLSQALYETGIRTKGDKLEANRLRDAVELFVRHLQAVTPDDAAAMGASA
jgi:putative sterol carrier protein